MMTGKRVWVRVLGLLLAALQVYPLTAMQSVPAPLSVAAQEVMEQVKKIPAGGKLTVQMGNGSEYHGRLLSIGSEEFSIREVDLKQNLTISYSDVNRVRKNYGGKGVGGKRVDPRRSLIVGATLIGTVMIILIVAPGEGQVLGVDPFFPDFLAGLEVVPWYKADFCDRF